MFAFFFSTQNNKEMIVHYKAMVESNVQPQEKVEKVGSVTTDASRMADIHALITEELEKDNVYVLSIAITGVYGTNKPCQKPAVS